MSDILTKLYHLKIFAIKEGIFAAGINSNHYSFFNASLSFSEGKIEYVCGERYRYIATEILHHYNSKLCTPSVISHPHSIYNIRVLKKRDYNRFLENIFCRF